MAAKIKVTDIEVHQTANSFPGITSKTINAKKYPGLEMAFHPKGILLSYKGKTGVIFDANIIVAVFEEEK